MRVLSALLDRWFLRESWYPGYCSYVLVPQRQYMVLDFVAWCADGARARQMQLFRVVSLPEQIQDGINFLGNADFVNGAWRAAVRKRVDDCQWSMKRLR